MSDNALNNLNSLENKILEFGIKLSSLFEKIKEYLKGNLINSVNQNDFENELDDIINEMILLKEEMHKRVEEIYKDNNLSHLTRIQNDYQEQYNSLCELKEKITKLKLF